jgi:hypothetical protein
MIPRLRKVYLAGFLDGDGSIYVRVRPNSDYRFGFQVEPHIVFFQSAKNRENFMRLCALLPYGKIRERKDGILEFTINRIEDIKSFLRDVGPYALLKQKQVELMLKIVEKKFEAKTKRNFQELLNLIDGFDSLNYSKKRKKRNLHP